MKCFAWIESAVQALAIDSKGGHRKDDRKDSKQLQKGDVEVLPAVLRSPITSEDSDSTLRETLEEWNDIEPTFEKVPEPIAKPTIRPISTQDLPIRCSNKNAGRPNSTTPAKEALHDSSLAFDYNPAVVAYISSGQVHNPRSLRRRNMSSTSTIFKNSPLAPITIIVTTPEDPSSPPPSATSQPQNPFNQIRAQRQSTPLPTSRTPCLSSPPTPPPSPYNPTLQIPDSARLKPPTEQQINASKLLKAREFREIRKFLINFLNTQASQSQFPKKLRCRIMEMYCITDADLLPATVAKFEAADSEPSDEGVALDELGVRELGGGTDADDLKILQMAFMGQIKPIAPTKEQSLPIPISPPQPHPANRPRKQSLINRRAENNKKVQEKLNDDSSLSWLGPLISTNGQHQHLVTPPVDSPPPRPYKERTLGRSSSVPDLFRLGGQDEGDVPPVPSIPSAYKRGRNSTLSAGSSKELTGGSRVGSGSGGVSDLVAGSVAMMPMPVDAKMRIMDQTTRTKRGNIISGAFGSIRGAIAGNKASRAAERRRLVRETTV